MSIGPEFACRLLQVHKSCILHGIMSIRLGGYVR